MYRILVDGNVFCDSRDGNTAIINPVVKLKVNSAGSMTFTIPPLHPHYDAIKRKKSVIDVYREDELIFSGICSEETVDFYRQKKITCEGDMSFLNDSILRPHKYTGETVYSLLAAYIAEHNAQVDDFKKFELGTVTVTDPNNYISCYTNMNSTMQEIKSDLIDDLGGYFRVRHANGKRYIDYLAESPRMADQTIELGKNLIGYSSNIDSTELATRVIPLGTTLEDGPISGLETRLTIASVNGGLDYLESPLAAEYGIMTAVVTFDNVTTASILKTKGQKYLNDIQFENVTISASAIDLGYVEDVSTFRLLDSVRVISEPHGMDKIFVLTEMTLNLNDPDKDTYKLGSDGKLSLTAKTQSENAEIVKQIEKNIDKSGIVDSAVKRVTAMIAGAEGGSVITRYDEDGRPYEMLILDTDSIESAKRVWRWNINGLGYSSNGVDGPFGLAMTANGEIVADYITAGTLNAGVLAADSITADKIAPNTITASEIDVNSLAADTVFVKTISASSIGDNLQYFPYYNGSGRTHNGITYVVNEDGSVTATGTNSSGGNAHFYLSYSTKPAELKAGETYTLSGGSDGVSLYLYEKIGDAAAERLDYSYTDRAVTFTAKEGAVYFISVRVGSGTTVDHVTVYPMLERGIMPHAYEPYSLSRRSMLAEINVAEDAISSEVSRATAEEGALGTRITQAADSVTTEIARATAAEGALDTKITQTADSVTTEISKGVIAENLITYPYASEDERTYLGVEYKVLEDGTVTASGTPTGSSYFMLSSLESPVKLKAGETYTLSGCPTDGSSTTKYIRIYFYNENGTLSTSQPNKTDSGSGVTFIVEEGYEYAVIYIRIGTAAGTIDGIVFKPMLEIGTIAHTYQPYELSRNVFNSRIKQAADDITSEVTRAMAEEGALSTRITQTSDAVTMVVETTIGENLQFFPYDASSSSTSRQYGAGTSYTNRTVEYAIQDDGSIIVNGTNNSSSSNSYCYLSNSADALHLEAGETYTVSGGGGNVYIYVYEKVGEGTGARIGFSYADTSFTFEAKEDSIYYLILRVGASVTVTNAHVYPMIEHSGVAHAYQRYEYSREAVRGSLALKLDTKDFKSTLEGIADTIRFVAGTKLSLTGAQIEITSGNFKLDATGNITATSGTVGGWTMTDYGWLHGGSGDARTVLKTSGLAAIAAGVRKANVDAKNAYGAAFQVFHSGKVRIGFNGTNYTGGQDTDNYWNTVFETDGSASFGAGSIKLHTNGLMELLGTASLQLNASNVSVGYAATVSNVSETITLRSGGSVQASGLMISFVNGTKLLLDVGAKIYVKAPSGGWLLLHNFTP